jgi:replication factor C subunit 2/4
MGREIFKDNFSTRVIEFNASDDRGINAVREKITFEAKKSVEKIVDINNNVIPAYKIIVLDEADSMTDEAQDALRVIIEEYSGVTRFCFICNYISKITDAIKSRCSRVYFKKLSDKCMLKKLEEVSMMEEMELEKDIFKAIIDISGGDMRKGIMLLQNIKYEYNFKKSFSTKICDMTEKELQSMCVFNTKINKKVTVPDVYHISGNIDVKAAKKIIMDTIACNNIVELSGLSKNIINMGYPIDNVITQVNATILKTDIFTDLQKAEIFQYSTQVLFRMKECAAEYLQLLHYLSEIYMIHKKNR